MRKKDRHAWKILTPALLRPRFIDADDACGLGKVFAAAGTGSYGRLVRDGHELAQLDGIAATLRMRQSTFRSLYGG
jgi:hypothetical protein